jgi:hypothetical protein
MVEFKICYKNKKYKMNTFNWSKNQTTQSLLPSFSGGIPYVPLTTTSQSFPLFSTPFSSAPFSSAPFSSAPFSSAPTSRVTFTDLSPKQPIEKALKEKALKEKALKLEKFNLPEEDLKDKFKGIFLMSCLLSPEEVMSCANVISNDTDIFEAFNPKTLGLHSLIKMDEVNLKKKLNSLDKDEKDLAFVFINTLYGLIEEDIKTPKDLYDLVIQLSSTNKALNYALRLIKAHESISFDFFGINPSHLECFVMALHTLVLFNNEPINAINHALRFDKGVLRFITWMLGASYGSKWIPEEWIKFTPSPVTLIEKFAHINNYI